MAPPRQLGRTNSSRFSNGLFNQIKPKPMLAPSTLTIQPPPEIRSRSLHAASDELDFVKTYEQHKLIFELNLQSHSKSLKEYQEELDQINANIESLSSKNEELFERIFRNFIDFETSVNNNTSLKQINQVKLKGLFESFDTHNNGKISEEDLKNGFRRLGKEYTDDELAEMMSQADANHTGTIDYGEFISLILSKVLIT